MTGDLTALELLASDEWCADLATVSGIARDALAEIKQLRAQVEGAKASLTEAAANLVGSIKNVDDPAVSETLRRLADIKIALSHTSTVREAGK